MIYSPREIYRHSAMSLLLQEQMCYTDSFLLLLPSWYISLPTTWNTIGGTPPLTGLWLFCCTFLLLLWNVILTLTQQKTKTANQTKKTPWTNENWQQKRNALPSFPVKYTGALSAMTRTKENKTQNLRKPDCFQSWHQLRRGRTATGQLHTLQYYCNAVSAPQYKQLLQHHKCYSPTKKKDILCFST